MLLLLAGWLVWRVPVLRQEVAEIERLDWDPVRRALAPLLTRAATTPPTLVLDASIFADDALPIRPPVRLTLVLPAADAEALTGAAVPLGSAAAAFSDGAIPSLAQSPAPPLSRAAAAYALLAAGDRRGAAQAFRDALATEGADARAAGWSRDLGGLEKRWSGWAYVYLRDSGLGGTSAAPVLGGGQSAAQLTYSIDPLANRPLSAHARIAAANSGADSAQLAAGLSWRAIPAMSVAVERLVPVGKASRGAWNLRVAGGYDRPAQPSAHWHDLSLYGEAGLVGLHSRDLYAAAILRGGERFAIGRATVMAGGGLWGSVQRANSTVSRFEAGPTVRLHLTEPLPLDVVADYRFRVVGNARPGSGPVLTVVTGF